MRRVAIACVLLAILLMLTVSVRAAKTDVFEPSRVNKDDGVSEEEAATIAHDKLTELEYKSFDLSKPSVAEHPKRPGRWVVRFPAKQAIAIEHGIAGTELDIDKTTGQIVRQAAAAS